MKLSNPLLNPSKLNLFAISCGSGFNRFIICFVNSPPHASQRRQQRLARPDTYWRLTSIRGSTWPGWLWTPSDSGSIQSSTPSSQGWTGSYGEALCKGLPEAPPPQPGVSIFTRLNSIPVVFIYAHYKVPNTVVVFSDKKGSSAL